MAKKPVSERQARAALIDAAERARMATGSAQWTNGYRACAEGDGRTREETDRLYRKEMDQWKRVTETEAQFTRALAAYRRAILVAGRTSWDAGPGDVASPGVGATRRLSGRV